MRVHLDVTVELESEYFGGSEDAREANVKLLIELINKSIIDEYSSPHLEIAIKRLSVREVEL